MYSLVSIYHIIFIQWVLSFHILAIVSNTMLVFFAVDSQKWVTKLYSIVF